MDHYGVYSLHIALCLCRFISQQLSSFTPPGQSDWVRAELKARRPAHLQLLDGVVELPAFHLPCMELIFLLGHQLSEGADLLLGISQGPLHTSQCGLLDRQRHLEVGQGCERLPKGIFETRTLIFCHVWVDFKPWETAALFPGCLEESPSPCIYPPGSPALFEGCSSLWWSSPAHSGPLTRPAVPPGTLWKIKGKKKKIKGRWRHFQRAATTVISRKDWFTHLILPLCVSSSFSISASRVWFWVIASLRVSFSWLTDLTRVW